MAISDKAFKKFTAQNVGRSPRKAGVYALYAPDRTLVFLGEARGKDSTIRAQLKRHLRSEKMGATRYKREVCTNTQARLKTLLGEHRAEHGTLPRGNTATA
jgi:hypothetical protein